MRLLILASGDLWAGAEVMIHQLCRGLGERQELETLVVLLNHGRLEEELIKSGFAVRVMDENSMSAFGLIKTLYGIVREFSPDVIHSHRYKENLLAWLVTRVKRGVKLLFTQHGMPETPGPGAGFGFRARSYLLMRLLSGGFDRIVAVSDEMRSTLVESHGFATGKTITIHNGIQSPDVKTRVAGDRLKVGSAGRLSPVKNYSLMVEIANLAIQSGVVVDFVLAGDGPEFDRLNHRVSEHGLQDRFKFLGFLADMDHFYGTLDVYINTSLHEGIPMSVLEAMSYQLPVLAPNVGGFREILEDGVSGFLVEDHAASGFVDRIRELLVDGRRKGMARAARQRVEERFSCSAMAENYYRTYLELVELKVDYEE